MKTCKAGGTTREYPIKRRHSGATYFFFTFALCLLLAAAALAMLTVDAEGRNVKAVTPCLSVAVSEKGEARLSLFGREVTADVSGLLQADRFLTRTGTFFSRRIPASLRLAGKGIPLLYREIGKKVARLSCFLFTKAKL